MVVVGDLVVMRGEVNAAGALVVLWEAAVVLAVVAGAGVVLGLIFMNSKKENPLLERMSFSEISLPCVTSFPVCEGAR